MSMIYGGQPIYGADIGIVMLDCRFPRPFMDPGNARSFRYPVQYEIVEQTAAKELTQEGVPDAVERLIQAAGRLEKRGAKGIVTSCGLLLPYQRVLTEMLSVPVVSSAILLLPFLLSMLGEKKKTAVVVSSRTEAVQEYIESLSEPQQERCILLSMEECPEFRRGILSFSPPYQFDTKLVERELIALCEAALRQQEEIGAFLLECTNLAPYSAALRTKTKIPVFDILGLIDFLYASVEE